MKKSASSVATASSKENKKANGRAPSKENKKANSRAANNKALGNGKSAVLAPSKPSGKASASKTASKQGGVASGKKGKAKRCNCNTTMFHCDHCKKEVCSHCEFVEELAQLPCENCGGTFFCEECTAEGWADDTQCRRCYHLCHDCCDCDPADFFDDDPYSRFW